MQSGLGGLGHCWSAHMNLAAVPEIDRWSVSTTYLVARLDAVTDLDLGSGGRARR
jgi:hypothetical protein